MVNQLRVTIDDRNFRRRLPLKVRDVIGPQDTYVVRSLNPKSNRRWPNSGRYTNFDLPRWMHETGGVFQSDNPYGKKGTQHIPRNKARYMYSARDYAKKNKTQWAKQFIKSKKKGGSLTKFVAKKTQEQAKKVAPQRTGQLVNLIKIFKGK